MRWSRWSYVAIGLLIAAGLNTLLIYLLTETAAHLGKHARTAASSGLSDASFTLAAIGESVINFGLMLSYVGFVLLLAGVPAALLADRSLRKRRLAAAVSLRGVPDLLEDLAASVADLEGDLASKREALQETEERRKRNEHLISVSHEQAEAVRYELRSEGRVQTKLWAAGIVIAVILTVVGIILAN